MQNISNLPIVIKARNFAVSAHYDTNCRYHNSPYTVHLQNVNEFLQNTFLQALSMFVSHSDESMNWIQKEAGIIFSAGWLHDTIEDCRVSYNDILKNFNLSIAEVVYNVTDELGKNRNERAQKTYGKIAKCPRSIIVKLADRYCNMAHAQTINHSILSSYTEQFPSFIYHIHPRKDFNTEEYLALPNDVKDFLFLWAKICFIELVTVFNPRSK